MLIPENIDYNFKNFLIFIKKRVDNKTTYEKDECKGNVMLVMLPYIFISFIK